MILTLQGCYQVRCVLFCFEAGSHYVGLAVLEFLCRSSCLFLLSAEIKGLHHHAQLECLILNMLQVLRCKYPLSFASL